MIRRKSYKKFIIIGFGLLLPLYVSVRTLFFSPGIIENIASYLVYPALVMQRSITTPIKSFLAKRKNVSQLEEQLAIITQERDRIIAQNIELHGMISFTQDTQELIDFKQRYNFSDAILAQVLVKNLSEQSHFFLIDKGARAGIQKDMVVIIKDCLIGKITEVYPCYSKAVLISDKSCKVAAYCTQSKATGIYEGNNEDARASLNHVSHLSNVEIGELILSSGDGLIFPRGFGLGKIKECHTYGLFHQITIEPVVDLRAIQYCYVVQKGAI